MNLFTMRVPGRIPCKPFACSPSDRPGQPTSVPSTSRRASERPGVCGFPIHLDSPKALWYTAN